MKHLKYFLLGILVSVASIGILCVPIVILYLTFHYFYYVCGVVAIIITYHTGKAFSNDMKEWTK